MMTEVTLTGPGGTAGLRPRTRQVETSVRKDEPRSITGTGEEQLSRARSRKDEFNGANGRWVGFRRRRAGSLARSVQSPPGSVSSTHTFGERQFYPWSMLTVPGSQNLRIT